MASSYLFATLGCCSSDSRGVKVSIPAHRRFICLMVRARGCEGASHRPRRRCISVLALICPRLLLELSLLVRCLTTWNFPDKWNALIGVVAGILLSHHILMIPPHSILLLV